MEGLETTVTLASGTQKGIVKDGSITIEEENEQFDPEYPKLISLGKLIQNLDLELSWTPQGAKLVTKEGRSIPLEMENFSPYVTQQNWARLRDMLHEQPVQSEPLFLTKRQKGKLMEAGRNLQRLRLRLRTVAELNRHRRGRHRQFSRDCPECVKAIGRNQAA